LGQIGERRFAKYATGSARIAAAISRCTER